MAILCVCTAPSRVCDGGPDFVRNLHHTGVSKVSFGGARWREKWDAIASFHPPRRADSAARGIGGEVRAWLPCQLARSHIANATKKRPTASHSRGRSQK